MAADHVTAHRVRHAAAALAVLLPMRSPADAGLRAYFRAHHELGQQDRAFVAETVFSILRRKRLLDHLAPRASARQLVLLSLNRLCGLSLKTLHPCLNEEEKSWLIHLKTQASEVLPLEVETDLPDWLLKKLRPRYSEKNLLALARSLNRGAPLDVRVNTLLAKREEVLKELEESGWAAQPTPYSPAGIRLNDKPAINRHPLFLTGRIEVQDEGSQLLAYLVSPRRTDMVVDFCAGAGGKTLALGALMRSQGRLYAFDVSEKRLAQMKLRFKRSGLSNVQMQRISNENDIKVKRLQGKIDRVLVDAPCSGLGTLRRNPDLKWRQNETDIEEMVQKQSAILLAASRLLKPGGRLVYATCSLLWEENEQVVEAFLHRHPEFILLNSGSILRKYNIDLDTGTYLKLDPLHHQTDGFFAAAMELKK